MNQRVFRYLYLQVLTAYEVKAKAATAVSLLPAESRDRDGAHSDFSPPWGLTALNSTFVLWADFLTSRELLSSFRTHLILPPSSLALNSVPREALDKICSLPMSLRRCRSLLTLQQLELAQGGLLVYLCRMHE